MLLWGDLGFQIQLNMLGVLPLAVGGLDGLFPFAFLLQPLLHAGVLVVELMMRRVSKTFFDFSFFLENIIYKLIPSLFLLLFDILVQLQVVLDALLVYWSFHFSNSFQLFLFCFEQWGLKVTLELLFHTQV